MKNLRPVLVKMEPDYTTPWAEMSVWGVIGVLWLHYLGFC